MAGFKENCRRSRQAEAIQRKEKRRRHGKKQPVAQAGSVGGSGSKPRMAPPMKTQQEVKKTNA